ncbi:hypothetical protein BDFB_013882, partial [Asbolus verrucosus]
PLEFLLTFHYRRPSRPVFPREVRPSRYRRNRKSSNNSLSFCNYSTSHATRSPPGSTYVCDILALLQQPLNGRDSHPGQIFDTCATHKFPQFFPKKSN